MTTYTDAAPARSQLQALAAEGFPIPWLAEAIGMSPSGLGEIQSGHTARTTPYTLRAIATTYHTLHGTNPADYGLTHGAIGRALLAAGRHGWTTEREEVTT